MSLMAEYLKERSNKEMIESEHGFATYYFVQDGCYIEDIFVKKEQRNFGHATRMAEEIEALAKQRGYKKLYGSVRPSANGAHIGLRVLIAYGFKLHSAHQDAIILIKELE